jgi:hypothetical protein
VSSAGRPVAALRLERLPHRRPWLTAVATCPFMIAVDLLFQRLGDAGAVPADFSQRDVSWGGQDRDGPGLLARAFRR